MNRDIYIPFGRSVELLGEIYQDENWVLFLSRNIHGLTEGFAPIPFDDDLFDVWYRTGDLERFAFEFGRGSVSAEKIASIFDAEALNLEALDRELDDLLGKTEDNPILSCNTENPISKSISDAGGDIALGSTKKSELLRSIRDIADAQLETVQNFTALAHAIRDHEPGDKSSSVYLTALSATATAQAGRACDNAMRIGSVLNQINKCHAFADEAQTKDMA